MLALRGKLTHPRTTRSCLRRRSSSLLLSVVISAICNLRIHLLCVSNHDPRVARQTSIRQSLIRSQRTVADKQTRLIWKPPKTEFCSARNSWEIISECRFGTFEQSGVEWDEPISQILNFMKKWSKILANPKMSFLIPEKMRKKFLSRNRV